MRKTLTVELANFIKNLLYNNDIVIIPGFGRLLTNYKPAEINQSERNISPPIKYLIFDSSIAVPDNTLAGYIALQKGTTAAVADKFITREVKSIRKKLDEGETVLLEGLGYFSKNEGKIRFEHQPKFNFLTNSFGLSNIDLKPVEIVMTTPSAQPEKNIVETPVEPTVKPQQLPQKPKEVTPKFKPPKMKKNYSFVWVIIVLLILVGGAYVGYRYYPSIIAMFKNPAELTATIDTLTPKTVRKDTTKVTDLEQFFDNTTDKKKALAIESQTYFIIAGSFKSFDRAKIKADQLIKEGYKAEVIQFGQDLYRVSIGKCKSKKQGLDELSKIRAAKGDNAAWMLTK